MSLKTVNIAIRSVIAVLSFIWAGIHLYLFDLQIRAFPLLAYFFLFVAILAIISGIVVILEFKTLMLPSLVFWWINYLLLTESRVLPAPVIGHPLPLINIYIISVFGLDILIIILLTASLIISRRVR
jgi:hypothetical protein